MGTDGMSFSLQSRDLIADSIETVMGAQWYDGNIALPGCDKNMPGTLIAMARLNRPSIMVYGGTIRAGSAPGIGRPVLDIVSAFQSYGEFEYGRITEAVRRRRRRPPPPRSRPRACVASAGRLNGAGRPQERLEIVQKSCPGPGACGGMYTANTMATAIEALGMSLPYSSSMPADSK